MDPQENRLTGMLRRGWWALLLRGLAAIAFAVLTWLQPGISLTALVVLFGAYALVDGVFAAWMAIAGRKSHEQWLLLLLAGLLGIVVGVITFMAPNITALVLLFYIAVWAIATGTLEIAVAIRLRKEIANEWLLILAGLASVAFGILLLARPGTGALAVLSIIAAYAFVFGLILVMLAFRARSFASHLSRA